VTYALRGLVLKEVVKRETLLEENMGQLFSLLLGQCTEGMKEQIKNNKDFGATSEKQDGLALLRMIKAASFNVETYLFTPWMITLVKMKFYGFRQQKGTLLTEYHNSFQNVRSLLILY